LGYLRALKTAKKWLKIFNISSRHGTSFYFHASYTEQGVRDNNLIALLQFLEFLLSAGFKLPQLTVMSVYFCKNKEA